MKQKGKIKKPKFIILSSPSGGGKSSLCNMILSARDNFVYSIYIQQDLRVEVR